MVIVYQRLYLFIYLFIYSFVCLSYQIYLFIYLIFICSFDLRFYENSLSNRYCVRYSAISFIIRTLAFFYKI